MNNYGIFTITRNHGLRAVAGATFLLDIHPDGRHMLKPKNNSAPGIQIDVALLASPHALVSQFGRESLVEGGSVFTDKQVTLTRFGLAQDQDNNAVLVLPEEESGEHVPGLTGVTSPALVWVPETELTAVNTGASVREQCWLMPGLVKLLFMSDLWLHWRDPSDRMEPPVSIKAELHGGHVQVSESRRGYSDKAVDTRLKPFVEERNRYQLPTGSSGRGVLVW